MKKLIIKIVTTILFKVLTEVLEDVDKNGVPDIFEKNK